MKLFADELVSFPPPQMALEEGIVDVSDDLRAERLLEAYSFGIFPWPHRDYPTLWFSPDPRGVLDFSDLHVPSSLKKFLAKDPFTYSFDRAFEEVIDACSAAARPGQQGSWITPKLRKAYLEFHRQGYAHSLEVWREDEVVGGLYGVYVAGAFCGESMFYRESNASKCAVVKLVEFLSRHGLKWMDIQMVTPVLEAFGGKYIAREAYLKRLQSTKLTARDLRFKN